MSIGLAVVRQNSEVPRFRDAEPGSLLCTLKISRAQDLLMVRRPPMWPARWTEDEFITVVKDDEGVVWVCSGCKNDTHGCRGVLCSFVRLFAGYLVVD